MKKLLCILAAAGILAASVSAQVLDSTGVKNTVWSGFGAPLSTSDAKFYGIIDTLQGRADVGMFTIDGMVNWGAVANWDTDDNLDNFSLSNTEYDALYFHYLNAGDNSNNYTVQNFNNGADFSNTTQEPYYVNFAMHPFTGFDFGAGTKLAWQIGPAPSYGDWQWDAAAHIRQGGYSTSYDDKTGEVGEYEYSAESVGNAPGTADVTGFVPYANIYAKKAIGARYRYEKIFEIGAAVPDGANTDNPRVNLAFSLQPIDALRIGAAYEGLFQKDGNLYAGVTFNFNKNFILDGFFAWDSIDTDNGDDDAKDMAYGSGAILTIIIPDMNMTIRPEGGFNWFENKDYTPAWYIGGTLKFNVGEKMVLGAWSSAAWGSKNENWTDKDWCANNLVNYDDSKDWDGGFIFDIRPMFTFNLTERHALTASFDFESRKAFDGKTRTCWSAGAYWTYRLSK